MYEVVDRKTGKVILAYKCMVRARNAVNDKDLEYGASRYYVRKWEPQKEEPCGK